MNVIQFWTPLWEVGALWCHPKTWIETVLVLTLMRIIFKFAMRGWKMFGNGFKNGMTPLNTKEFEWVLELLEGLLRDSYGQQLQQLFMNAWLFLFIAYLFLLVYQLYKRGGSINFSHLTLQVSFQVTFIQSDNQNPCFCHWTHWWFWIIVSSLGSHSFNHPYPIGHHQSVSFMFRVQSYSELYSGPIQTNASPWRHEPQGYRI